MKDAESQPARPAGASADARGLPACGRLPLLPPGPPSAWWGLPLLRAMRRDYLGFVAQLQRDHGELSFMRLGRERVYDVFAPELVRAVLVDHADRLIRWERGIEVFEQVFGQSVLVTEGETWKRQRRMLQAGFTPRRVAGYAALMGAAAAEGLDDAIAPGRREALVDMDALFTRVTMDVILRTLFSSPAPHDAGDAAAAVQVLSQAAMREMFWPVTLPDWLPLPGKAAKRRALRRLRELVGRHIEARRNGAQASAHEDLLDMLLGLRDEETGSALSPAEVFDQCMVSFQAGHETTATALLWWVRLLAEHPEAARRARLEVDAALAGRQPGAADLSALPWLTATLKEAMRLYPPVPALMSRRAIQDLPVGQYLVPRGSMIRITPWVIQRDPRLFDHPDAFQPARFLPDAPQPVRGAWLPFGTGPRVCLGQHFALLEMSLVAALLLQRFEWALPAGAPPADPVLNVTLRPRGGGVLLLRRRTTPI
ncbi:MAG: cytochrome P450 [Burkholderiaceae bacterium]|nr:cytochrome P450 [Burkholderiaceae bacterium]